MWDGVKIRAHDIWFVVLIILLIWPGYNDMAEPERPKKGR
jgi:hypothetical protein